MLVVLVVWRHLYARFPFQYDPQYWAAVFPLGMFAACTVEMAHAMSLEFQYPILRYLVWGAMAAWAAAFAGLVRAVVSKEQ